MSITEEIIERQRPETGFGRTLGQLAIPVAIENLLEVFWSIQQIWSIHDTKIRHVIGHEARIRYLNDRRPMAYLFVNLTIDAKLFGRKDRDV